MKNFKGCAQPNSKRWPKIVTYITPKRKMYSVLISNREGMDKLNRWNCLREKSFVELYHACNI